MSLRYGILGLLRYSPQSGYDLVKTFNDSLRFFWQATGSQVYRELKHLEEAGLVSAERVSSEKGPDRRVYHLEPPGLKSFQDWITGFSRARPEPARSTYVMRLFFSAALSSPELTAFLHQRRREVEQSLEELDAAEALVDFYARHIPAPDEARAWRLSISFGRHMAQAHLEWIDRNLDSTASEETASEETDQGAIP
ncbi:transcriptional regulator, PadR family [Alkalispirochaeta americana]|uniref:Transcriptional regulator, PadR family n=1 Tax=Alkalispirochaeta americana TaxID=159291 RepID=A0A1N6SMT5_9SPIO|nr:PadR family transcriptional regulator [Alkalispirochaeta americana]SIQ42425.1 transcriptional regulator, PadR family [Alkalispirochaeta americana]